MAEGQEKTGQEGSEDLTKNMKEEFNRKLSNIESKLTESNSQLANQLNSLVQTLETQRAAPKQTETEDDEDLIWSDPKKYKEQLRQETLAEAKKMVEETQSRQAEQQQAFNQIYSKYPELHDNESELFKKVAERIQAMPQDRRNSMDALKATVMETAADLGVLPKNKRAKSDDSDDFVLQGGSGSSRRRKGKGSDDIELLPETLEFAQLVGLDIKDEKVIEGLKAGHKKFKRQIDMEQMFKG